MSPGCGSNSSPWTAAWSSAGQRGSHCTTGPVSVGSGHWLLTCRMARVTQGVRQGKTASPFPGGFISLVSEWCCQRGAAFKGAIVGMILTDGGEQMGQQRGRENKGRAA